MTKRKRKEDDWRTTEVECLQGDVSALRAQLRRVRSQIEEAMSLQAAGASNAEVLERALHPILGENTTGYLLRALPESKEQWFKSWGDREAEIAKLRAAGVRTIELAELPARSCCITPWYKPRPVRARAKR